jgi:hypothetical protein
MPNETDHVYSEIKKLIDRGATLDMVEKGLKEVTTEEKAKKFMKMAQAYYDLCSIAHCYKSSSEISV